MRGRGKARRERERERRSYERREAARRWKAEGWTNEEIARQFGVSTRTVQRWVNEPDEPW